VEHEEAIRMYYSEEGAEKHYRNWGSYDDMHGIYAIHSGFYPTGVDSELSQRESIKEMDRQIIERLQLDDGQSHRLVDLGCGSGAIAIQVGLQYPNVQVCGVTIASEQAVAAQRYIRRHGVPNVHIGIQDFTSLGFSDASFDRACFVESLMHAGSVRSVLSEAARVLRTGGILHFQDTLPVGKIPEESTTYPLLGTFMEGFLMPDYDIPLEGFLALIESVGFRVVSLEDATANVFPSAKLIGDHAEMQLKKCPDDSDAVKVRRKGCVCLRDLMSDFEEGKNKIGYYFITAKRVALGYENPTMDIIPQFYF